MLLRIRIVSVRFAVAFAFAFCPQQYAALHPNGPTKPESHAPATGGQLRWSRPQRAPRSFLLTAAVLGQLLLQRRRNEVFRLRLGMIALAEQCRLHLLALLNALDALQQIVIDALAHHGILPVKDFGLVNLQIVYLKDITYL